MASERETRKPSKTPPGGLYGTKWLLNIRKNFAADIGHIAMGWTALHAVLGSIFAEIIARENKSIALAAWGAVTSDRSKRHMLQAAAQKAFDEKSKFVEELNWALGRMNALEDRRNDAVHAPYGLGLDDEAGFKFFPALWSGDRRAEKLRDKDLKLEFASCISHIDALTKFARALHRIIQAPQHSPIWPARPPLQLPAHPSPRS